MPVGPGTRIGPYDVLSLLGAGGMGEVYRARDAKLARDVALKIVPERFAGDPDRLARFQREAQILASLNHPNIAAIYGLDESVGIRALVLELVEGPTLADRIEALRARGSRIGIDEALPIGRQIAEALEAAHEQGVIHRDLKPANIKLRADGVVKVLDFGLAKLAEEPAAADAAGASRSPTVTTPAMTGAGMILGTAAYMSPEQARGRPADTRSDVWAFGCVLYEMLTGRRAFEGETVSETLADVLKTEPDWNRLPTDTPPSIRRLLRRCLQKNHKQRLQHIGDARIEIDDAAAAPDPDGRRTRNAPRRWERPAWVSAAATLGLLAAGLGVTAFRSVPPVAEVRFEITTPPTPDPISLAISPDGQTIVFVATFEGRARLWLRSLSSVATRSLAGTEGGFYPFWSADSRSIAFFADGKLQRIDIDGGLVRTLATAPNPLGGSWNRDDTILFTPSYAGPIFRVSANGGEATAVTRTDARQGSHRFPQFLPDHRRFLYYVPTGTDARGVYVGQIEGGTPTRILDADAPGVYAASQYLLFVSGGRLIAQGFDPAALALRGTPVPIAEQVIAVGDSYLAGLSASAAGPLVYRAGLSGGLRQFTWFDRSGKEIGKTGDPDSAGPAMPSLSPDGRLLAINRTVNANTDIWMLDLGRRLLSRSTFDSAPDSTPVWSPDNSRIAFNSNRNGVFDLYQKPANGNGDEELLLATPQNKAPVDWSPDGRIVLYRSPGLATGFDLWALPVDGTRKPFPVVQTNFEERDGQFSPDGKWLAYQSNESGRMEIIVQPFPGPGGKLQVSTSGGAQVRWRADGKELFYIALDGRLMAVPMRIAPGGQSIEADAPVSLFVTRVGGAVQGTTKQQYVVSRDGERFLMNTVTEEGGVAPITVVLNWKSPAR